MMPVSTLFTNLICFIGNSALDEDDTTLLSEGRNLQKELQFLSIRLDTCLPLYGHDCRVEVGRSNLNNYKLTGVPINQLE